MLISNFFFFYAVPNTPLLSKPLHQSKLSLKESHASNEQTLQYPQNPYNSHSNHIFSPIISDNTPFPPNELNFNSFQLNSSPKDIIDNDQLFTPAYQLQNDNFRDILTLLEDDYNDISNNNYDEMCM